MGKKGLGSIMKIIRNHLSVLSIIYLTLPLICFFFGWLKLPIAIMSSIVVFYSSYKIYFSLHKNKLKKINKKQILFWIFAIVLIIVWVYLSGIGGFRYQRRDFFVRNPIYHDLIQYNWPLKYDLSLNSQEVQNITGTDEVAFVYYFSWWLPICVLSKIFHFNMHTSDILLFIYSSRGILLILYEMNQYLKKNSYIGLILLILFSGLDILSLLFKHTDIMNIEWWTGLYQFTANTSLLYYCFNQAIPIWLITILILRLKDNKAIFALFSLSFVYSPWSIFGLIPISIYLIFQHRNQLKDFISIPNILLPLFILFLYGSFYYASNGNVKYELSFSPVIYLLFVLLEVGIYFIIIHKEHKHFPYYYPVLIMLLIAPFICSYPYGNNFTMRSTTIPLFLLMIYIILFLESSKVHYKKKMILFIFLMIGACVPFLEFRTSITHNGIYDPYVSFSSMSYDNKELTTIIKDQFFCYHYQDQFFFKYLSK